MKLDIRRQGIEIDREVQDHLQRRLHFALAKFGPRVQAVTIYLGDLNGPKGGVDKRCRVVARLARIGVVTVEVRDTELNVLVDRAAGRLAGSIQRTIERRRDVAAIRTAR